MKYFLRYKKIILLALLVFFISFFSRIIYIEPIPANINPDALDTLQTYMRLKYSHASFFDFNWNGAPAFNTYLIGFFWQLFDKSIVGLRFASVLLSSFTAASSFILFYLLSKRWQLSFFLALSLSFNPWFLNFSRDGWENIFNSLFLNLILIGLFFISNHKNYLLGAILISIGSILGFYGYHPGKFFIIASIISLLCITVFNSVHRKISVYATLSVTILFLIFTLPQITTTIKFKERAFDRINAVSVFRLSNPTREIIKNSWNNFRGFFLFDINAFINDNPNNARYLPMNRSPIFITFLPFYLLGIFVSLKRHAHFFLTFLITLLPVQILSGGTPDGARAVHTVGLIYLFILLGFNYIIKNILFKKLSLAFLIIIISATILDTQTYFKWINQSSTLNARQPAVKENDYTLWETSSENAINRGGWITGAQWEQISQANNLSLRAVLSAQITKKTLMEVFWEKVNSLIINGNNKQ